MSEGLLPPFLGYFSHVIRELLGTILDTFLLQPLFIALAISAQLTSVNEE